MSSNNIFPYGTSNTFKTAVDRLRELSIMHSQELNAIKLKGLNKLSEWSGIQIQSYLAYQENLTSIFLNKNALTSIKNADSFQVGNFILGQLDYTQPNTTKFFLTKVSHYFHTSLEISGKNDEKLAEIRHKTQYDILIYVRLFTEDSAKFEIVVEINPHKGLDYNPTGQKPQSLIFQNYTNAIDHVYNWIEHSINALEKELEEVV